MVGSGTRTVLRWRVVAVRWGTSSFGLEILARTNPTQKTADTPEISVTSEFLPA